MKLILGSDSSFLFKYGYDLTGIPKDQMRIGYITTASNYASSREYVEIHKEKMREAGYTFEEINTEGKSQEELKNLLKDKNVIHVEGGDTYHLLKSLKKTGAFKVVEEFLNKRVVYIGTSAGSSIVGPSIEFSSHIPANTIKEELIGFGLVPFLIKAHYTDSKRDGYLDKLKTIKYPIRFIRDGQGILVEDGKYTFVGEGEEMRI